MLLASISKVLILKEKIKIEMFVVCADFFMQWSSQRINTNERYKNPPLTKVM
jgi:hypothetical protein